MPYSLMPSQSYLGNAPSETFSAGVPQLSTHMGFALHRNVSFQ